MWGLSQWVNDPLFDSTVTVVLGHAASELPAEFVADRCRLYFGPNYDLEEIERAVPHALGQLRAQLGWIEKRLNRRGSFMLGSEPGLADALCYSIVWFIKGRYALAEAFLAQYPALLDWVARVRDLGHGTPIGMTASEALQIAKASQTSTSRLIDSKDPQQIKPDQQISVAPLGVGGDPVVTGKAVVLTKDEIALRREDPEVGEVIVHFPRVGYALR